MIAVTIQYTGTDGRALAFAREMTESGTVEKIRQEPGNISYTYYQSLSDPETVLLLDIWKDQEAIDMHHASPMMQTIIDLREKYDLHMQVQRYIGEEEMPEYDRSFIRS